MSLDEFKKKEWFPNYIILCKPIVEGEGENSTNIDNKLVGLIR